MRTKSCALAVLAVLLTAGCVCCLRAEQGPPKDEAEAEKWFDKLWERAGARDIQFHPDQGTLTFEGPKGPRVLVLYWVNSIGQVVRDAVKGQTAWRVHWTFEGDEDDLWVASDSREEVERFRQALLHFVHQAQQSVDALANAALERFKHEAETWRALNEKPQMPDEAYKHKVLAEEAYKEKRLAKAMNEYESALSAFHTWPEGQFNAGLIEAELGHYRGAIHRMQEYLLLTPNAPDAQAVKDKIIIWQDKIVNF